MINFGPSTITWESINQIPNGNFELWSTGNNATANNWYCNNVTLAKSNNSYRGNYAAIMTQNANCSDSYAYSSELMSNNKPAAYWRGKPVTARLYARGNGNNSFRFYLNNGSGAIVSNNFANNANWTLLTLTGNINNSALTMFFYPRFVGNYNNAIVIDEAQLVEGPYTLGKTFGGGSINLLQHTFTGLRTKNLTSLTYGGEGVIHMFQWNNSLPITADSTIYDYGKLTITSNNMTIVVDCCKLLLGSSFPFGQYQQYPLDITFSFKKSPDTGNIITIS